MNEMLDEFVRELQNQIYEETKAAYGINFFQRWENPRQNGVMSDPDGYGCLTGGCGDRMEIFLKFNDERVKAATYRTDGCGSSNVSGSFAAEMALGKSPDELLEVTGEAVLEMIGGLPPSEQHCAFLAAEALQEALNDYMIKQTLKGHDKCPRP